MSTTEDETVSIWLDRQAMPRTDWSDRSEVDLTVDGDTVVMIWHEWDVRGTQSERRHVFHGSTRALAEQVGDIRAGGWAASRETGSLSGDAQAPSRWRSHVNAVACHP